ncbi:hypothetical protein UFOVP55_59 [uncultured Caudovirales phage]|uniref:Uncharacterized protein n=1 Tax=uncultured Caudovirales phage TaxID=2100421 RepID=A0A6J5KUU8_9CAUD|nr:hypothetical protein UFOVP55_59 [uncultured Caudovirales phage]
MFTVYEVTTGETITSYEDERFAWSHAATLNDDYAECMGLEYSVKAG